MSNQPLINHMCIIGVGLIGGSLARAARQRGLCASITGAGRNQENLTKAQELGVIDTGTTDLAEAVKNTDLVVLAVPVGQTENVLAEISKSLADDTIVTDVGSTKRSIVEQAREKLGNKFSNFVPGHPIAGTEQSGVESSFAELFQDRRVILTPESNTSKTAVDIVTQLWSSIGATVTRMNVDHHDEVLAATSHLPHMLAYALVDSLARMHEKTEIFEYAAGGFRDFTRIASSNPEMWHDICMSNRDAILKMLDIFQKDLSRLTQAIRENDSETIRNIFSSAKQARDQLRKK